MMPSVKRKSFKGYDQVGLNLPEPTWLWLAWLAITGVTEKPHLIFRFLIQMQEVVENSQTQMPTQTHAQSAD